MSTNYTGNPTAIEAPAAAPGPNVAVIIVLPADGDPESAASIAQAFKALADNQIFSNQQGNGSRTALALWLDGKGGVAAPAQTSDTPLLVVAETVGQNARSLVDHNGFPMGRYNGFSECWLLAIGLGASAGPTVFGFSPSWSMQTGANASITQLAAAAGYPTPGVTMTPGTANTNFAVTASSVSMFYPDTNLSLVMEWEFVPNTSLANITWQLGFNATLSGSPAGSGPAIQFSSAAGGNWQMATAAGGGLTLATPGSPIAPVVGTRQRFRIEYHGSATPIGIAATDGLAINTAKARFFINGVRYGSTSTTLPNGLFNVCFSGWCTGAATGSGTIGPVRCAWNRFAAIDVL